MEFQKRINTEAEQISKFQQIGLFPWVSDTSHRHILRIKPSEKKVPVEPFPQALLWFYYTHKGARMHTHLYNLLSTTMFKQISADDKKKTKQYRPTISSFYQFLNVTWLGWEVSSSLIGLLNLSLFFHFLVFFSINWEPSPNLHCLHHINSHLVFKVWDFILSQINSVFRNSSKCKTA